MVGRRLVGRPGFNGNKTNSAQSEAGARAELGNNKAVYFKSGKTRQQQANNSNKYVHYWSGLESFQSIIHNSHCRKAGND